MFVTPDVLGRVERDHVRSGWKFFADLLEDLRHTHVYEKNFLRARNAGERKQYLVS